jgi:hypothetical protein
MVVTSFYKKLDWQHFLAFNNLPATNEEELANCTNLNNLSMSIKILKNMQDGGHLIFVRNVFVLFGQWVKILLHWKTCQICLILKVSSYDKPSFK